MDRFDYIVIGAGTAGCVLANRLSADRRNRVLVLEAGGMDDWIWFKIPVGYLFAINNPRADWMFRTEAEAGLNGRALIYPRGKVIGGCSSINAMIYMRGQAADYDHWRQLGLTGWGWDDVLPVFKTSEDYFAGASALHGAGGEWRVEQPRVSWAILDAFRDAAVEAGIPASGDFNTGDNTGAGYFHVNQKKGTRWSAARGFLKPALSRPNLKLETGAEVERLLIENGRVTGVRYRRGAETVDATAEGSVILSSGSIGTVQVLERSGIGQAERLKDLGIAPVLDRPGVGENLQDHLQMRMIFGVSNTLTLNQQYYSLFGRARMGLDYALFRKGPLTMAPSQLGIFTKSSPEKERADLQFHVQPLSLDKFGDPLHRVPAVTSSVCNLRPDSRGSVHITAAEVGARPSIRPNYLSTDSDRETAARAIRVARHIAAQPALARFKPVETLPGGEITSDEALAKAAGDIGTTIFHPVGTARMGRREDPNAVVDERLKVIGIEGLRIADASIMPTITSGNTNSPTLMIGEKAAAMILEDARG